MEMDPQRFVEITGADLRQLVRVAYRLSRPVGMGFLHYREGEIPEEMIDRILDTKPQAVYGPKEGRFIRIVVNMDYVMGRAVKLAVWAVETIDIETGQKADKLYIERSWFDHGHEELCTLLTELGVERIPEEP